MAKQTTGSASRVGPIPVGLRCPYCGQIGTFEQTIEADAGFLVPLNPATVESRIWGIRKCPNISCNGVVCVVLQDRALVESYPPSTIEFDTASIPENIVSAFREAIITYSHECYLSSAIMIRRTLEEICGERGATGRDLKQRLQSLRSNILIPNDLMDAADELRMLGNDAAHLEAKIYENIGKEEVLIGLELTREILKSVYQMANLVRKLRSLQKEKK